MWRRAPWTHANGATKAVCSQNIKTVVVEVKLLHKLFVSKSLDSLLRPFCPTNLPRQRKDNRQTDMELSEFLRQVAQRERVYTAYVSVNLRLGWWGNHL